MTYLTQLVCTASHHFIFYLYTIKSTWFHWIDSFTSMHCLILSSILSDPPVSEVRDAGLLNHSLPPCMHFVSISPYFGARESAPGWKNSIFLSTLMQTYFCVILCRPRSFWECATWNSLSFQDERDPQYLCCQLEIRMRFVERCLPNQSQNLHHLGFEAY